MGKDLIIAEVKVNSGGIYQLGKAAITAAPQKDWSFPDIAADYTPTSGPGVVKLDLKIENQPVTGCNCR